MDVILLLLKLHVTCIFCLIFYLLAHRLISILFHCNRVSNRNSAPVDHWPGGKATKSAAIFSYAINYQLNDVQMWKISSWLLFNTRGAFLKSMIEWSPFESESAAAAAAFVDWLTGWWPPNRTRLAVCNAPSIEAVQQDKCNSQLAMLSPAKLRWRNIKAATGSEEIEKSIVGEVERNRKLIPPGKMINCTII